MAMDEKVLDRMPYWLSWAVICFVVGKFTAIGAWSALIFYIGFYAILEEKPPILRGD
jgi:hypothetical protein